MIHTAWFLAVLFGLSLASKRQLTSYDKETKRNEDLFLGLVPEVLEFKILPLMDATSVIMMSMTSKMNYQLFNGLFDAYHATDGAKIVEEFMTVAQTGNKSSFYYLVKQILTRVWPKSEDCLLRSRLEHLKHTILTKAHNLQSATQYPVFFLAENEIPYIHVPGTGSLAQFALTKRTFSHHFFSYDLVTELPFELIKSLNLDRSMFQCEDKKCISMVTKKEFMEEIQTAGLLNLFVGPGPRLFQLLLNFGLDNIPEDSDYFAPDVTIALLLHQTNPKNIAKVKRMLGKLFPAGRESFVHSHVPIFCQSHLSAPDILDLLQPFGYEDTMMIYALLMDEGRKHELEWYTKFHSDAAEEIKKVLESFSAKTGTFEAPFFVEEPAIEFMLFVAVCQDQSDEILEALFRRTQFKYPLSTLFFLLLAGKSEDLVRYFLSIQMNMTPDLGLPSPKNLYKIPSKVTIPLTLLPDIIISFKSLLHADLLIPDPEKLAKALHCIHENSLWTNSFNIPYLIRKEIMKPRPLILQTLLELATEDDFNNFAIQPIFLRIIMLGMDRAAAVAQERLPVLEFLNRIPTAKLVDVILMAGPQTQDIMDTSSPGILPFSMLPLIYRVAFTHPEACVSLYDPNIGDIQRYLIETAWKNMFPELPCPEFYERPHLIWAFFIVVKELHRENVKANSIIYLLATHAIVVAGQFADSTSYPADFTFFQKSLAIKVLAEVAAFMPDTVLLNMLNAHKNELDSPFTEVAFKELMGRPDGYMAIAKAKIMNTPQFNTLQRAFPTKPAKQSTSTK